MKSRILASLTAALVPGTAASAAAQSGILLQLRAGAVLGERFRVDSSGAFVAYGFVRDVGNTTGSWAAT